MTSNPTNSNNAKVTELTADAIRGNGVTAADNIRSYAKQVRDEGETLAAYAEEVADAITQAAAAAADRIAGYMKRCEDARASIQQHLELLRKLPDETPAAPRANLDSLEKDLRLPQAPNFTPSAAPRYPEHEG